VHDFVTVIAGVVVILQVALPLLEIGLLLIAPVAVHVSVSVKGPQEGTQGFLYLSQ
jgi:hypothetical protein